MNEFFPKMVKCGFPKCTFPKNQLSFPGSIALDPDDKPCRDRLRMLG